MTTESSLWGDKLKGAGWGCCGFRGDDQNLPRWGASSPLAWSRQFIAFPLRSQPRPTEGANPEALCFALCGWGAHISAGRCGAGWLTRVPSACVCLCQRGRASRTGDRGQGGTIRSQKWGIGWTMRQSFSLTQAFISSRNLGFSQPPPPPKALPNSFCSHPSDREPFP